VVAVWAMPKPRAQGTQLDHPNLALYGAGGNGAEFFAPAPHTCEANRYLSLRGV